MAIVNTVASILYPFRDQPGARTPKRVEHLQTIGSAVTSGAVEIFGDATASDDFALISLVISQSDPTAATLLTVYAASTTLAIFATGTTDTKCFNFGAHGLRCGTTTTGTVSFATSGGTSTVTWVATGLRDL